MNKPQKRTLVLAAAGLLTTTAGVTSSTAQAAETCEIADPDNQPGGEVAMSLSQLQSAEARPAGGWRLYVLPADLAGIEVPDGTDAIEVHLTNAQMNTALQVANAANSHTVVFAVKSEAWVNETEERLLGGFSVRFNTTVCPYNQKWS